MAPEDVDSYECVHVLNFFGFPFSLEEDNVVRPLIKDEFGFDREEPFPCLYIDSSHEEIPNLEVSSLESILRTLQEKKFIDSHISHSAKEVQTRREFIEGEVSPLMSAILYPFKQRVQFYSVPRHFKQVEPAWEVSDFIIRYFNRLVKTFYFYNLDRKEAAENQYG